VILLDTNVVSALMRPEGRSNAVRWLDSQRPASVYISTIVLAELRFGLELLEPGRKQMALERAYERIETELFAGRILSFDQHAAVRFGKLRANRRKAGKPIAILDALIAAVALANTMTLATRNTIDFEGLGLPLVNPFEISGQ
jgi:toxin FitB